MPSGAAVTSSTKGTVDSFERRRDLGVMWKTRGRHRPGAQKHSLGGGRQEPKSRSTIAFRQDPFLYSCHLLRVRAGTLLGCIAKTNTEGCFPGRLASRGWQVRGPTLESSRGLFYHFMRAFMMSGSDTGHVEQFRNNETIVMRFVALHDMLIEKASLSQFCAEVSGARNQSGVSHPTAAD